MVNLYIQRLRAENLPKRRSQGSTGAAKHQTPPPPIVKSESNNFNSKSDKTLVVYAVNSSSENRSSTGTKQNERNDLRSSGDTKLKAVHTNQNNNKSSTIVVLSNSTFSSQLEFKNVENDIYVRHPHPRISESGFTAHQESAKNNFSTTRGYVQSTSPATVTVSEQVSSTKLISESIEVISTQTTSTAAASTSTSTAAFSLDIATHCAPTESRNLSWNWTPIQQFASQPCPSGSKGTAKWLCKSDFLEPQWFPSEADLSDCISHWVLLLEESVRKDELSATSLARQLMKMTRIKTLLGGDIHKVTDIVNQLVTRMEIGLEDYRDYRQRNQFVKEVLDLLQDIYSNLVEDSQRSAWLDLPLKQRNQAIADLIGALERTSTLLSETNTANSDYSRKQSNICKRKNELRVFN
ncbi:G-protein coupled receptor protein-like protein [Dinothrombium tinctorium]|uniref:G-protein coupled receptor protein-like protein n=1 Tax=Dinothrombium tinctorium TaxID=1965070 RepID=A0A3S3NS47_9ACAR|nr:G-protein coupled receptor protein-like protein [Dinothrombium tinctorium]